MREQYWEPWERLWVIPFPLDLKAQHGLWDQWSKMCPAEDLWSGARGEEEQGTAFQPSFLSLPKQGRQPLESCCGPSAPPILKIGGLFLYTPERGGTVTLVLRDPGAAGSPVPFQNHPSLKEHRSGGRAEARVGS